MCGPIALALPVNQKSPAQALVGRLLYNGGRIIMYALLGLLFGTIGQSIAFTTSQQNLSILIGVGMLVLFILPAALTKKLDPISPIARFTSRIKQQFALLFTRKSYKALFGLGLLNGLLPCGLVYVALAGTVAMGSSVYGMAYMALFGLGTAPMMFAVSLTSQLVTPSIRFKLTKVAPVFTVVLACLLIIRGLNLNIPMLSPGVEKTATTVKMSCCHKR
jgi:hypothetical protein